MGAEHGYCHHSRWKTPPIQDLKFNLNSILSHHNNKQRTWGSSPSKLKYFDHGTQKKNIHSLWTPCNKSHGSVLIVVAGAKGLIERHRGAVALYCHCWISHCQPEQFLTHIHTQTHQFLCCYSNSLLSMSTAKLFLWRHIYRKNSLLRSQGPDGSEL